jgi:nitrous oxidase accessory protein NosD
MAGDHSRFTFEPKKYYSAVLKQQGRVGLDSDANEHAEIQDRRWRAETMDIMGDCVVSDYTNPNAFEIDPFIDSDRLDLRIGRGRIYVDGLLVENHGTGDQEFDADLEEMRGEDRVTYHDQPFYPSPLEILSSGESRFDLVYLDVWRREVTALEDPDIREVALDGPDTATRLQTVWQVRVFQGVLSQECDDDRLTEELTWREFITPSACRLTVTTVAPPPSDLPCELSPEGGYRGLENRLYRVEIHDPGSDGDPTTARFKWSRDNASVAAAVEVIEEVPGEPMQRKLRLSSLGRDRYLRFSAGNWIEVHDDHHEFEQRSGEMVRIAEPPDEVEQSIIVELADDDQLDEFAPETTERHTRIRRWDSDSLLDVELGSLIDIEQGVQIQFTLGPEDPARFKAGDYWVFAARTATGEVDELHEAPPRGIHHHYCRLALVQWAPGSENEDPSGEVLEHCPEHWPPTAAAGVGGAEGCCVVVEPGDSIQNAIDSLGSQGGCVCLKAGEHPIREPITISTPNIVLQGVSLGARVVRSNGFPLLHVDSDAEKNIIIKGICFQVTSDEAVGGYAVIRLQQCRNTTLSDCLIEGAGNWRPPVGVRVDGGDNVRIVSNRISSVFMGIVLLSSEDSLASEIEITGNTLTSPDSPGMLGIYSQQIRSIVVRCNRISDFMSGVNIFLALGGTLRVEDNDISVGPYAAYGIVVSQSAEWDTRSQNRCLIQENRINFSGEGLSLGLLITGLAGADMIRNQVTGFVFGIALYRTTKLLVAENRISQNTIHRGFAGIFCVAGRENRLVKNNITDSDGGILAYQENQIEVSGNTILNVTKVGLLGVGLLGAVTLSHNRFYGCGYIGDEMAATASIAITGSQDTPPQVTIESCHVLNTGINLDEEEEIVSEYPTFGILVLGAESCRIQGNEVKVDASTRLPLDSDRALWLAATSSEEIGANGCALVLSNQFRGSFPSHLVEFHNNRAFERVTFSENFCENVYGNSDDATVSIAYNEGPQVIAMGNHEERTNEGPAFDFGELQRVVFLGNVARWEFGVSNPIPVAINDFNVEI